MNPRIDIYVDRIKHNTRLLVEKAKTCNINLAVVTKSFCAMSEIVETLIDTEIKYLADSRIENLKKMQHFKLEKMLLRLPMISQVNEIVQFADISLNSEIVTIRELNKAAIEQKRTHKIIIMQDVGDLREGIFNDEEMISVVREASELSNIKVVGVGTNLSCFGGVIPDKENLGELVETAKKVESILGYPLEIISGGNSSSLYLIDEFKMPKKINNLRIGEGIVLGGETTCGLQIEGAYIDTFVLTAEIIEIKQKPSVPIGKIGLDAFGNVPSFKEKGNLIRAILAVGKQDFGAYDIFPIDTEIKVLGSSSDHLIIDITSCEEPYKIGDEISFTLGYGSLLALMTSEYIYKNIVCE
ncbi:MAG: alanine racemase [Alkaliphilus sp.]|nr:alanine/ornithine racemase family PLP-dependent enzyme [bacterium AH-315-E09]PHS35443.1 MAG: alanine racemase [Alkaliphilus sp.]